MVTLFRRARRRKETGYVALITVLIVGAVATAVAVALLNLGTDSQRNANIVQQAKEARSLAIACGEEASQVVHDNTSFNGTNNLALGQGTCSYNVYNSTNTGRVITATGTVGNVVRKVQATATIGASNITMGSWYDVGNNSTPLPSLVQSKMNSSASSVSSMGLTVNSVQKAGDVNVVVIGWDSATGTISSVSDTAGNAYTLAMPIARGTGVSLAIFYAKNIVAAQPNITAFFSAAVASPDLRVAEYTSVDTFNPLDVTASATGSGIISTVGSVSPTYAKSVIFAAGQISSAYNQAGTGFTSLGISTNGNIFEHMIVSSLGSYTTNARNTSGNYAFQAIVLKGAGQ
jgi:hypothetical protein